ncbi:MAG: hypothetical protein R3B09_31740 [Nannocystaceae bacterium]
MVTVTLPAEAASWSAPRPSAPASVSVGALGVLGFLTGDGDALVDPTQSQRQTPEGGQSQSQSRQSQSQRAPAPDRDDDDDDAFFDEVAGDESVVYEEAPEVVEEVIEIEVPEGYTVEYEILEEGGVRVLRPRLVPAPGSKAPPTPTPPAAPPQPPSQPPSQPQVAPAAAPAPTPTVEVSFHSPTRLLVQRFVPTTGAWVDVCWAPCRAYVPRDASLRTARKHDIPKSKPFRLHGDRDRHALVIRPGSRQQQGAGIGVALLSMVGMVTGAVMVDATARFADHDRRSYEGYLVLGMASVTYVAGIAMAIANRTAVREAPKGRRLALIPGGVAF